MHIDPYACVPCHVHPPPPGTETNDLVLSVANTNRSGGGDVNGLVDGKLLAIEKAIKQQKDIDSAIRAPPKMKLSVHFAGVQVKVPESSVSDRHIVLNLGLVRVKNLFQETKQQHLQNFLVSLSNLEAHIKDPSEEGRYDSRLLRGDEIRVVFCQPVFNKTTGYEYGPNIALDVDTGSLKVSVANTDVAFLKGIPENNLAEMAVVCKPSRQDSGDDSDDETASRYSSESGFVSRADSLASFAPVQAESEVWNSDGEEDGDETNTSDTDVASAYTGTLGSSMSVTFHGQAIALELNMKSGSGAGVKMEPFAQLSLNGLDVDFKTDPIGIRDEETGDRQPFTMWAHVSLQDIVLDDTRSPAASAFPNVLSCGQDAAASNTSSSEERKPFVTVTAQSVHGLVRVVGHRKLKTETEMQIWHYAVLKLLQGGQQKGSGKPMREVKALYVEDGSREGVCMAYAEFVHDKHAYRALEHINKFDYTAFIQYADWAQHHGEFKVDVDLVQSTLYLTSDFLLQLPKFAPPDKDTTTSIAVATSSSTADAVEQPVVEHAHPLLVFSQDPSLKVGVEKLTPPGDVTANVNIAEQTVHLMEDSSNANSRAITLKTSAHVRFRGQHNGTSVQATVDDLTMLSCDISRPADTKFYIIPTEPHFGATVFYKKIAGEPMSANVLTNPLALNLATRDVNMLMKIKDGVMAQVDLEKEFKHWPLPQVFLDYVFSTGIQGKARVGSEEEKLSVTAQDITVTIVDNLAAGAFEGPVLMASMKIDHMHAYNWSSKLSADGQIQLAVAAKCPSTQNWEPLLVGSRNAHNVIQPFSLDIQVSASSEEQWVPDLADTKQLVKPRAVKCNRGFKRDMRYMLDGKADSYWHSGGGIQNKFVVFDMGQQVTLTKIKFVANHEKGTPKKFDVFVGPNIDHQSNTWTKCGDTVITPGHEIKNHNHVEAALKPASGRYIKWVIYDTHGGNSVRVMSVHFSVITAGATYGVLAPDPLELTVSSSVLASLKRTGDSLTGLVDQASADTDDDDTASDGQLAGSCVLNMTGFAACVSQEGNHNRGKEGTIYLQHGESQTLKLTDALAQVAVHSDGDDVQPITDINILDFNAAASSMPRGWEMMGKCLSPGTPLDNRMIVQRGGPLKPITDIWIKTGGQSNESSDPIPLGYEPCPQNVTGKSESWQDEQYLCFQRGNGAPIIELQYAVPVGSMMSVPYGFKKVPKALNSSGTHLCVKRQLVKLKDPSVPVACAGSNLPITELCGVESAEEAKALVGAPAEAGCTPWVCAQRAHPHGMELDGTPQKDSLTDGSQGVDKYLLLRNNPQLPPITSVEVVSSSNVPNHQRVRSLAQEMGVSLVRGKVNGITEFGSTHHTGHSSSFIGYTREVGAPPITRIGFYVDEHDSIPAGFQCLPAPVSKRHTGKHRSRLVVQKCDVQADLYDAVTESAGTSSSKGHKAVRKSGKQMQMVAISILDVVVQNLITVELDGWAPLNNIPVNKIATSTYVLSPTWRASAVSLSVSIVEVRGRKTVTLSAPVVIKNRMDFPIEVCYQQEMNDETVLDRIDPGGRCSLPIGMYDNILSDLHVPLRRLFNLSQKQYHYTVNTLDVQTLFGHGWVEDGIVGYVTGTELPGMSMLWGRKASTKTKAGGSDQLIIIDHHQDKKKTEETTSKIANSGMEMLGYVYTVEAAGRSALYEIKIPGGRTLYTPDNDEAEAAVQANEEAKKGGKNGVCCFLFAHKGAIRVRPAGGTHKWSRVIRGRSLSLDDQGSATSILACDVQPDQQLPGFLLACGLLSDRFSADYDVIPMLKLRNTLPYAVLCGVTNSKATPPSVHHTVAAGKSREPKLATDYSPEKDELFLWVSLSPAGKNPPRWSLPARIVSREAPGFTPMLGKHATEIDFELDQDDRKGQKFSLDLAIDTGRGSNFAIRTIILMCPIIVHNQTSTIVDCITGKHGTVPFVFARGFSSLYCYLSSMFGPLMLFSWV